MSEATSTGSSFEVIRRFKIGPQMIVALKNVGGISLGRMVIDRMSDSLIERGMGGRISPQVVSRSMISGAIDKQMADSKAFGRAIARIKPSQIRMEAMEAIQQRMMGVRDQVLFLNFLSTFQIPPGLMGWP